jgi:CRISPR-associated protein Cas1
VFHKPRFRSEPLVYDLMEAFRPAVELMLAEFMLEPDVSMKAWSKKVGTELRGRMRKTPCSRSGCRNCRC